MKQRKTKELLLLTSQVNNKFDTFTILRYIKFTYEVNVKRRNLEDWVQQ